MGIINGVVNKFSEMVVFFVNFHYIKEINNKKILREGVRINLFGNRVEFFEENMNSLSI